MATSPLFGWEEPDDVDLVKDGAAAIRTLGNAIDTSMGDLLGGTTGQVLSKASNTNMDFTWVTSDDANAIQNAIVDAKGDLIAASAADTPARLAVGNNGETLVADSSTSTGLGWTGSMAGGKNAVIGGGFDYWQRGTSFNPSSATYAYTADRWEVYTYAASTCTVSQQSFTAGAAPVAGVEGRYFLNIINTNTGIYLRTKIEDVRTYAGQTVTLSFYAKASSNLTLSSNVEQNFGTGGSGSVANSGTHSVTTSWQRFTRTITLASISGKTISSTDSSLQILFTGTTNITLSIWGVQLEYGSVATQFSRAGGTLQGELAACQRYFYRFGGLINNEYFAIGTSVSAGTAIGYASPKVSLRGTPTLSFTTASNYRVIEGTSQTTATSVNAEELSANNISFAFNASGFTIGRANRMNANNTTNGYIDISAEL